MVLNFGCILQSAGSICKSIPPDKNTGPNKSECLGGMERAVLLKASQLLLMCTPVKPLHYMGRVYYRKTELISFSFFPHVGILERDELVLFPKLWQLKAT